MLSSSLALPGPMRAPDSKTMLTLSRAMPAVCHARRYKSRRYSGLVQPCSGEGASGLKDVESGQRIIDQRPRCTEQHRCGDQKDWMDTAQLGGEHDHRS